MKQTLLIFFFAMASMTGFSQLVIDSANVEGDSNSERISLQFTITNTGTQIDNYYWDLERTGTFPDEWDIQVCDCFTCYDWGFESGSCDEPCTMEPGERFTFYVYIRPNGVVADGSLEFELFDVCGDDSTVKANTTLTYLISPPSSTATLDDSNILIFPNPAFNSFQINDDAAIKSIVVYNIVGKEMLAESHNSGQRHDVKDLDKGIYLVRMMDKTNEVVKVVRLTKE